MVKKNELFDIVKSLTSSEKRHFTIVAGRDSNHARLFRAIDAQEHYDESAIRALFRGEPFLVQLHVTKNYLRGLIYRSLRDYHRDISAAARVKDLIFNADLVFRRELFGLAQAEIDKAAATAERYELDTALVEIARRRRRLLQTRAPTDLAGMRRLIAAERAAVEAMLTNLHEWEAALELPRRRFKTRSSLASHLIAAHRKYRSLVQRRQNRRARTVLAAAIARLEAQPHRIADDPLPYSAALNNLASYHVFMREHDAALRVLEKARTVSPGKSASTRNRPLLKEIARSLNIELEIWRDRGPQAQVPPVARQAQTLVETYGDALPAEYRLSFLFQLASIFFSRGEHARALGFINALDQIAAPGIRTDLRVYGRVLNLMIHHALRNFIALGCFVNNTRRFLKKHKAYLPWSRTLLRYLATAGRGHDAARHVKAQFVYDQLFPAGTAPLVPAEVLDYLDLRRFLAGAAAVPLA